MREYSVEKQSVAFVAEVVHEEESDVEELARKVLAHDVLIVAGQCVEQRQQLCSRFLEPWVGERAAAAAVGVVVLVVVGVAGGGGGVARRGRRDHHRGSCKRTYPAMRAVDASIFTYTRRCRGRLEAT